MSAHKKQEQINLLAQKGFEATTSGRILLWILSSFRVIVIVTEIIVMIAFLSRFWLDAQSTDLKEEIQQKQAVIAASLDFEKEFKKTQKKLSVFSEITQEEGKITLAINTVGSLLPPDAFLKSVAFSEQGIEIEGSTPNERSIQQIIVNLDSSNIFQDTILIELATPPDQLNLLNFKIRTQFKEGK